MTWMNIRKIIQIKSRIKKFPKSDLTFSYKLESARFNPDRVPLHKFREYFIEVFDMLRKYEEAEII